MRKSLPQKIFQLFFILIFAMIAVEVYAESPFATIKDKIKEEINRGKAQFKEELQRVIDQTDNNANEEYQSVVPFLIGKTPQEAEIILPQYHLVLGKVIDKESDKPIGSIISQSHRPDSEIKQQTAISVEVAIARTHQTKDTRVRVPNLHGMPLNKAKIQIKNAGLLVGAIQKKESDLAINTVIGQQPKSGTKLRSKSKLNLIIAKPITAVRSDYKITLVLDKTKAAVAETVVMKAIVEPVPSETLEYSFTIDGKVYSSSSNQFSRRFSKVGKSIVTANARKKRGKWQHSKSQWLLIEKQKNLESTESVQEVPVPNVIGLSLDEAEALLKQSNLLVGTVLQEKSLGKSRVLKQQPEAGLLIAKGSEVQLTQSIEHDVQVTLSANKTEIKQYETVNFQAVIQPANLTSDAIYRLLIGDQVLESQTSNWKYTFDKSGKHHITTEVEVVGVGTYRSSEILIQVSSVWDEPIAVIEPSSLIIKKGDTAVFTSQSTHDESSDLTLYWMDAKGGSGTDSDYSINTKNWDEGEYWLSLRIKDKQGFEHTSKAELIITSGLKSAKDDTESVDELRMPKIAPIDVKLSLSASSYHVIAGKTVQFTITQHPMTQSEYRVIFDDGSEKKSTEPWVEHIYSQFGQYLVYVETSYQKTPIKSKPIKIWVWPSGLLLAAIGIGLLFLLSFIKFLKPKKNKWLNKKNSTVRYMPVIDEGEQNMEVEANLEDKKSQISFQTEIDEGKQWIAYGKQTKDG